VLPWAFICAKEKATEQEFRQQVLQAFTDHKALDFMFDTVKKIALQDYRASQVQVEVPKQ
jgi:CRISPR-associated protein Cas1